MSDTAVMRLPEYRVMCAGYPGHDSHEFSIYRETPPGVDEMHFCNQCRTIMQGKPQPHPIPLISLDGLLKDEN
jgi:hypothetical protein